MKKTVLTIKWGREFSARDVNLLCRALRDHCSLDIDFACLTDDPTGLDDSIRSYPIPMQGLAEFPRSSGAWPKVCLFHPALAAHFEQVLYVDIDTLVTGNIDAFFDDPGDELRMLACGPRWRDFNEDLPPYPASGVMAYNMDRHANIFEDFVKSPEAHYEKFIVEQNFVGHAAKKVTYFPLRWIQSFKYHLRRQFLADLVFAPKPPNADAKMVAFHGFPRPRYVAEAGMRWARFPRSGLHRPKWVLDYYRKYDR